ncbi:DUF916 and DUF3324 domain-containing protein [Vagococcus fessus]|uniref:Uncharacterized protein n=1 Tax=Vagococcus fessus TaxID=120370 RepID=A0A430A8D0_9ENTE|nr:DUF916 and DUF3324 domain-containing protein [Vagococcus fessus]RSU03383.1 hypothetical protein CBF31_06635 [Vagococcus fessus]
MKRFLMSLTMVVGCLAVFPTTGLAEGNSLSVQPEAHENAIDKTDTSSFNLKVKPDKDYTLKVTVKNGSKKETSADILINDAYTTPEGVIAYGEEKVDLPDSMKEPVSELIKTKEKNVTLKPGESKVVEFKLKTPKESFKGIKLGAIYVLNAVADSEKDKMFKNRFSYTVPVMLTESDEQIKPNLEFVSLENIQENKRNYLQIKLENTERNILSRGIFKLDVFKGNEKIASQSKEEMSIAPNSYLPYQMQWGDNNVVPGTYTAKFSFDTPYGVWKWEEKFEISREKAKKLNDSAIHVNEKPNNMPYIIGGIIAALVAAGTGFFFFAKKKKEKEKEKIKELENEFDM